MQILTRHPFNGWPVMGKILFLKYYFYFENKKYYFIIFLKYLFRIFYYVIFKILFEVGTA